MLDSGVSSGAGAPHLLERASEMEAGARLMEESRRGHGAALIVEGQAGIGKTALLEAMCDLARKRGLHVLRARGGELERGFPHGVVRGLFESDLRARSPEQRAELLAGAAALASTVVAPGAPAGEPGGGDRSFAVDHGLYWLTANFAEVAPLVLAVDDAQWSDVASLRALLHLTRRVEDLAVVLVLTVRTGEDAPPLLEEIASQPATRHLQLAPLSLAAVARLVEGALGEEPHPDFSTACHEATGGVPFLLAELLRALAADGVRPEPGAVPRVSATGPQTVARATLRRLSASADATELARAVAVLGADGSLHRAARLAGLAADAAAEVADRLVAMGILRSGRPLDFVHPIVRSAVYDDLGAAARVVAHARAADMLDEQGAEIDSVAAHLLLTEPQGRTETVHRLRDAADHATARGAPESASAYLRRALEEGGIETEERADILFSLARVEKSIGLARATRPLEEALELARAPVLRAQIAYELADAHFYLGGWERAGQLLDAATAEVDGHDPELKMRLETIRAGQALYHSGRAQGVIERVPQLFEMATSGTPAARVMALLLAGNAAWHGWPLDPVRGLVDVGLDGGRFLADEGPEAWVVPHLLQALLLTEDLDRVSALIDEVMDDGRRRGSAVGLMYGMAHRAWLEVRRGDLVAGEADLRAVFDLFGRWHSVPEATLLWVLLDAVVERPHLDDVARRIEDWVVDPESLDMVFGAQALEARGRVRLVKGRVAEGIDDLVRCGETSFGHGTHPNAWAWRAVLAPALAPTDRPRALELAHRDLDKARRVGVARGIGIGLRTLGLVEGGREGLAHLEEAVEVLRPSPARLELARALVELGAALRRANRRAAARGPLRDGLDLAHRCGAVRLAERAREELVATGARPRRELLTGRDALTATERRIARLAAAGMSNPEIAQALFITRKTVENHLGRVYGKLGIDSRERLADALAGDHD